VRLPIMPQAVVFDMDGLLSDTEALQRDAALAAAAAGMMTVMVPDLLEATAEMRRLCLHVARNLHEVRAMLPGTA
jgi:beta-phosphoglucomutase-like phosphatase (HAD superfamily)